MNGHYLEDIRVGDRFRSADYTVTEGEIIEYATQYDPQPFHTDPTAAQKSIFGGLIASGWFTASITMRLIAQSEIRIAGGLLGHWAVWTHSAVAQFSAIRSGGLPAVLTLAQQVTDANSALFDPAHQFLGCIAGLHEVLRRQGILEGRWCLDPAEDLSPGQSEEIDRVCRAYPHLRDDLFVSEHLDEWLR